MAVDLATLGTEVFHRGLFLDAILRDDEPSAGVFRVAAVIIRHYNPQEGCARPGIDTIATQAKVDPDTASRAVKRLRDLRWFNVEQSSGGSGRTNKYYPNWDRVKDAQLQDRARKGRRTRNPDETVGVPPTMGGNVLPTNPDDLVEKPRPSRRKTPTALPGEYSKEVLKEPLKESSRPAASRAITDSTMRSDDKIGADKVMPWDKAPSWKADAPSKLGVERTRGHPAQKTFEQELAKGLPDYLQQLGFTEREVSLVREHATAVQLQTLSTYLLWPGEGAFSLVLDIVSNWGAFDAASSDE